MSTPQDTPQNKRDDWVKFSVFATKVKDTASSSSLRHILFHRDKNGANHFCRQIGTKLILSPSRFFEWIDKPR